MTTNIKASLSHNLLRRRFPRYLLNPSCRYPIAVRMGILAEYLVSKIDRPPISHRDQASYRLLSMTGHDHLLLLRESLYSFLNSSTKLPPLEILNDGSIKNNAIRQVLDFWPEQITIFSKHYILHDIQSHPTASCLKKLIDSHVLGLKLAFILCRSKHGKQLFVDSDILWFRDPSAYLCEYLDGCSLAIGREDAVSVNHLLARSFCPSLLELPGPNSGCVWSTKNLLDSACLYQVLLAAVQYPSERFNEQTIFAILACSEGEWLSDHVCDTSFSDRFDVYRPSPQSRPFCSRHYVSIIRHLFFLDVVSISGGWIKMFIKLLMSRI